MHSLGLYADRVLVADRVTPILSSDTRLSTASSIKLLFIQLQQVARLLPLIGKGIVSLTTPHPSICNACRKDFKRKGRRAIRSLCGSLQEKVALLVGGTEKHPSLAISAPLLSVDETHPMVFPVEMRHAALCRYRPDIRKLQKTGSVTSALAQLVAQRLMNDLDGAAHNVVLTMATSRNSGATLVAGSRVDAVCVAAFDDRRLPLADLDAWEEVRSVQLPWIRDMTANEIVMLREEASNALPRLRSALASKLGDSGGDKDGRAVAVAKELQEQASEVESELRAANGRRERRRQLSIGGLGFSIVLYGLASGATALTAAGLGGLLAALGHLHGREQATEAERARLESEPAYVLLKARQIVARRH